MLNYSRRLTHRSVNIMLTSRDYYVTQNDSEFSTAACMRYDMCVLYVHVCMHIMCINKMTVGTVYIRGSFKKFCKYLASIDIIFNFSQICHV